MSSSSPVNSLQQQEQQQEQQEQEQRRLNLVPDSLLALAKDVRYVKECQNLFLQVLSSMFPRRHPNRLEQESWILGTILCLALGLKHTASKNNNNNNNNNNSITLGMETVGLQFSNSSAGQRWKLFAATIAALGWAYVFSPDTTSTSRSSSRNNNSNNHPSLTNTTTMNTTTMTTTTTMTQRNDEFLRGESRRQFHLRQRQAMLRRAQEAAAGSKVVRNNIFSPTLDQNDADAARPNTTTPTHHHVSSSSRQQRLLFQLKTKLKQLFFTLAQIMAATISAPYDGPHTLPSDTSLVNQPTTANNQQQQHFLLLEQQQFVSPQQIGRWIAKLQLAHFCLTGMYPTWIHRLTGHDIINEPTPASSSSRLYHQQQPAATARLVGILLGAQAVAVLVQTSLTVLSRWMVLREEKQRQLVPMSSMISEHQPAIVFTTSTASTAAAVTAAAAAAASTSTKEQPINGTGSNMLCSICKHERTHPAAPSTCGHVFCWRCLLQWVSAVRPECPLCRASCRPQDILALHNYSPNANTM